MFAHETAAEHYEHALVLTELEPEFPITERVDLLFELGAVAWRSGDRDRARLSFRQAADLSGATADTKRFVRAALGLCQGDWFRIGTEEYVDAEAVALLEEAAERSGCHDSPSRALSLACLAKMASTTKSITERRALVQEAVGIARRLGDPLTLALVLSYSYTGAWTADNIDERSAIVDEVGAIASTTGDEQLACSAAMLRVAMNVERGDANCLDKLIREEVMLAERLRSPAALFMARSHQTMWHTARGEFAAAERTLNEAFEAGTRVRLAQVPTVVTGDLGFLCYHRGELEALLPLVTEAVERSPLLIFPAAQALCLAQAAQEREGRAVIDGLIAEPGLDQWPRTHLWLLEFTLFSEAIALVGSDRLASQCYEKLLPFRNRQSAAASASVTYGSLEYVLGRLARRLGCLDESEAHYTAAITQDREFFFRPLVARSRAALASLLVYRDALGDQDRATTLLEASRAVAEELGMQLVLAECDDVDAQLSKPPMGRCDGLHLVGRVAGPRSREPTKQEPADQATFGR